MKNAFKRPKDKAQVDLKKTAWLYFFILPTVIFCFNSVNIKLSLISLATTIIVVALGHSVGLHRGIIHKSYQTSKILRCILSYLFVQTGLGSPLAWLKLHYVRDYWQNRKDCPGYFQYHHGLLKDYWWNLHLTYQPNDWTVFEIPKEDLNDPWLKWLDKTWRIHVLSSCLLVWTIFGFEAMITVMFLRISATILGHWFIGFITHKYGYSHFDIDGADVSGKNNWVLGLVSFGEGFHNNHHAHPRSAKFGLKWYEFDLGWQFIKLLRRIGLIWEVYEAGEQNTLKKQAKIKKINPIVYQNYELQ
jgi:stearoyl-CoA desaturase (delta-9 desaturase)